MTYSAYAVANAFVRRAQEGRLHDLSANKLQKLIYFAHAWHLRVLGLPLIHDIFVRWPTGPALPCIAVQFRAYRGRRILQVVKTLSGDDEPEHWTTPVLPDEDTNAWSLVDTIIRRYGSESALKLSDRTHAKDSAWSQGTPDGSPIPNDIIRHDLTL